MNIGVITERRKIAGLADIDHVYIASHNHNFRRRRQLSGHICTCLPNLRI